MFVFQASVTVPEERHPYFCTTMEGAYGKHCCYPFRKPNDYQTKGTINMKQNIKDAPAKEQKAEYDYCTCDHCLGVAPDWMGAECKYGADEEGRLLESVWGSH